jgi:hypothetical protein
MTSLIHKIENLFHAGAGAEIEHFVVTIGGTALKVAKESTFGTAILNAIKAGEAGTNAVQKIGLAIESLAPTIVSLIAPGGVQAAQEDIETTARIAIEDVLAQLKNTGPLGIITEIGKVLLAAA